MSLGERPTSTAEAGPPAHSSAGLVTARPEKRPVADADGGLQHRRSLGLDVFRGLTMIWLLVLVYTPGSGLRGHAEWWGWGNSDIFFPAFLFIAGAGLAYQTRRKQMPWPRLIRRFVILVVVGLAVNAILDSGTDWEQLRIPGVLQRVALVGLVGAVVVSVLRRRWSTALVAAVIVAGAWTAVLAVAAADCPGGLPTPDGCGTFVEVDERAFGASHIYRGGTAGHDPEGIASSLGALATFLVGYSAALFLWERSGRSLAHRLAGITAMGATWVALLPAFLQFQPVAKRLWTGSFVALTAAGCLFVLAIAMAVFDRGWRPTLQRGVNAAATPFVAVGRNALLMWVGMYLVDKWLGVIPVGDEALRTWFVAAYGPWGYFAVFGGMFILVALALHRLRWYVRL